MGTKPTWEPIGAGLLARLLTISIVKARDQRCFRWIWKPSAGLLSVFGMCVKVKPYQHLGEAHAMQFVAQHTSLPVPKVHCAFVHDGKSYIVMSRLPGQMAWGFSKKKGTSVDGGCFCDCRLPTKTIWGPFPTARCFHEALANGADLDIEYEGLPPDVSSLFEFYRGYGNQVVLTHGALSSLNILVRQDEVVGIVDWDTAGWFPPYWEYVCAKNVNPHNTFWSAEVDRFLTPLPHELEMDGIRRKHFGDF
ncbi:Protein kinase-like domain protein [Ophiocordyceps sinensis CO18]|uniref:Protein kinase-like domain protein n=1 Tax=Ophiocordyceps sinensis (strain Co18 / CGMCC 3.14243) TaxID=911162 RepID=T5AG76_OPHSC|nr:Protein kinase-like domain protein [Ophiocordyceps sinensis CO18]